MLPGHQTKQPFARDWSQRAFRVNGISPMPMYYFHLRDDQTLPDVDGTDLLNASDARDHAIGVAQELMFRSEGMLGHNWALWKMSVHDNEGNELFSFRLTGPTDMKGQMTRCMKSAPS